LNHDIEVERGIPDFRDRMERGEQIPVVHHDDGDPDVTSLINAHSELMPYLSPEDKAEISRRSEVLRELRDANRPHLEAIRRMER